LASRELLERGRSSTALVGDQMIGEAGKPALAALVGS
jgi:hypothetical protein